MALNRPLLAVAGGALLVILASLGGLAWLQLRTGPPAQRLIREANALERDTYPRPAHVPSPSPGTFGEAVGPLMAEVLRAAHTPPRLIGPTARACLQVSNGAVEPPGPQAACLEVLERERALLYRVLATTHTAAGGLPPGLRVPSDPEHPHAEGGLEALLQVVRLAALETRRLLLAGRAEAAVDTCVDALALARELTLGGGLHGRILASNAQDILYRPCAAALDAAPAARQHRAAAQLVTLREGLSRFSRSLYEESTSFQLTFYAPAFLDAEERGALAPLSRRIVDHQTGGALPPQRLYLALRLDWRRRMTAFEGMRATADLPAPARRRAFDAVAVRYDALEPWLPGLLSLSWGSLTGQMYQECADLAERQRLQLAALATLAEVDAARAEQGHWPSPLAPTTAGDFMLDTPSAHEARLTPRDPSFSHFTLRFTAP